MTTLLRVVGGFVGAVALVFGAVVFALTAPVLFALTWLVVLVIGLVLSIRERGKS